MQTFNTKYKNFSSFVKGRQTPLRRPPRLEGKVQNRGIKPKKK